MHRDKDEPSRIQACCLLTFCTVDLVDVFTRAVYKQIIVHSLNHFIDQKGLIVYGWCLMTNQLHLLMGAKQNSTIEEVEKEFKTFTSKKLLEAIETEPGIRRTWILERVENYQASGMVQKFQVWQTGASPVFIDLQKIDSLVDSLKSIHAHPVRERIVDTPCDYLYSSARDYSGMHGLVNISALPLVNQQIVAPDTTSSFFGKFLRN